MHANGPWRNILHDPKTYPDPFSFKPERFLPQDGKELPLNPALVAFGFGRRWVFVDDNHRYLRT